MVRTGPAHRPAGTQPWAEFLAEEAAARYERPAGEPPVVVVREVETRPDPALATRRFALALAALVLVAVAVLAVVVLRRDRSPGAGSSNTPPAATGAVPTPTTGGPTATASPAAATGPRTAAVAAVMPSVVGQRLDVATSRLRRAGTSVTAVNVVDPSAPDGTVLSQDPAAGAPRPATARLTVARHAGSAYLVDLPLVEGISPFGGPVDLGGQRYLHTLYWSADAPAEQSGGWNLGRNYRRFQAVVGPSDRSASGGRITFQVLGDGQSLYEQTLTLGNAINLTLDVTGVQRLRLKITRLDDTGGIADGVWADAQIVG